MRACASGLSLASAISTPIRRICPACSARAASGHAAMPPASVMKSRRLIGVAISASLIPADRLDANLPRISLRTPAADMVPDIR